MSAAEVYGAEPPWENVERVWGVLQDLLLGLVDRFAEVDMKMTLREERRK